MTHPTQLSAHHRFVYKKSGIFACWPANGGIWQWGDEILVQFQIGTYAENWEHQRSVNRDKPIRKILARSLDGGESIEFVSWLTHNIEPNSLMASTVRLSDTQHRLTGSARS